MTFSGHETRRIIDNLLKAKGLTADVRMEINRAEADVFRVMSLTSQLSRGDITGLLTYLTRLGPYGIGAAIAIGIGAAAYGIYQQLTTERPTEYYYWRYPK